MTVPLRIRRPMILIGVALSLVVGVATIRAAADWTAASAPLGVRTPSVESLQSQLAVEQERSAHLQAQLEGLANGSADLSAALTAARDRITTDAAQAKDLQTSLKTAKVKLAALERSLRRQAAATRTTRAATAAPATPPPPEHGGDDD